MLRRTFIASSIAGFFASLVPFRTKAKAVVICKSVSRVPIGTMPTRAISDAEIDAAVEWIGDSHQSGVLAFEEYRYDLIERINLEAKSYHVGVDGPPVMMSDFHRVAMRVAERADRKS